MQTYEEQEPHLLSIPLRCTNFHNSCILMHILCIPRHSGFFIIVHGGNQCSLLLLVFVWNPIVFSSSSFFFFFNSRADLFLFCLFSGAKVSLLCVIAGLTHSLPKYLYCRWRLNSCRFILRTWLHLGWPQSWTSGRTLRDAAQRYESIACCQRHRWISSEQPIS